jgi:hypothetical protein
MDKKVETIKYFLTNIFEAKSTYEEWKMICFAKSSVIVGKELAENYVKIQNYHPQFFVTTERACLLTFVVLVCHAFDNRLDSFSLDKADKNDYKNFISQNKEVIDHLKKARNKIFAHRDIEIKPEDMTIPGVEKMDDFFKKLSELYSRISRKVDKSVATFDNASKIKNDIENLYMNLEKGESIRRKEIDINWLWKKDSNKISDKV